MRNTPVREWLEQEHDDIDDGIAAFVRGLGVGLPDVDIVARALDELRRHIFLEEELLFPALSRGGLVAPVMVMLREHADIWHSVDRLEVHLRGTDRSGVQRALCDTLTQQISSHNIKEELILYPQADVVMTHDEAQRLRRFMVSGRLPAGWSCQYQPRTTDGEIGS